MKRVTMLVALTVAGLFLHSAAATATTLNLSSTGSLLFDGVSLSTAANVLRPASDWDSAVERLISEPNGDSATAAAASLDAEAKAWLSAPYQAVGAAYPNFAIDPGSVCIGGICITWPPFEIIITPQPKTTVPEPSTLLMMALSLVVVFASFGRRRSMVRN